MNHFEKFESYIPVTLTEPSHLLAAFAVVLFFVVFRYFLMVLPFHFIFYRWQPEWTKRRQIYPQLPGRKEQLFELKWSLITSLVFAATGVLMGFLWEKGWTQIYLPFDQYGWPYLFLSWIPFLFLHDTYFYWTHRWLHRRGVYERYHAVHHASLRPSPWASFSFHPLESVINALAIPLIILFLPLHPVVILFHLTFMTLSAITNHMGFEVLPRSALRQKWGLYLISGVHHTLHHRFFRSNYGLFFTFWDRWMKTELPRYEQEFDRVFTTSEIKAKPEVEIAGTIVP